MLEAVQAFHDKHDFKHTGGEEMTYRVALMSEELGEISSCVTKGKSKQQLAEEVADLFILLIGTAALFIHAAILYPAILTDSGLNLGFVNAVSLIALLTAALLTSLQPTSRAGESADPGAGDPETER